MIALTVPACTPADLRSLPALLQGATGSMLGGVAFRNVTTRRCVVGGRPRASLLIDGRVVRSRAAPFPGGLPGRPVRTIRPGASVRVYLQWSNWCGAWPATVRVRLALTTGVRLSPRVVTGRARCDARSEGSRLAVSAFRSAS